MAQGKLDRFIGIDEIHRFSGGFGPLAEAHPVQLSPLVLQEDFHSVALRRPMLRIVTCCRQEAVQMMLGSLPAGAGVLNRVLPPANDAPVGSNLPRVCPNGFYR